MTAMTMTPMTTGLFIVNPMTAMTMTPMTTGVFIVNPMTAMTMTPMTTGVFIVDDAYSHRGSLTGGLSPCDDGRVTDNGIKKLLNSLVISGFCRIFAVAIVHIAVI